MLFRPSRTNDVAPNRSAWLASSVGKTKNKLIPNNSETIIVTVIIVSDGGLDASPSAEGVRLATSMIPCSKADHNRDQVPDDRGPMRDVGPTFGHAAPETKRRRVPLLAG